MMDSESVFFREMACSAWWELFQPEDGLPQKS